MAAQDAAMLAKIRGDSSMSSERITSTTEISFPDQGVLLLPALSGVFSDEGSDNTVTSTNSWTRTKSGCGLDSNSSEEDKLNKAAALSELIKKFSGGESDFVGEYCGCECEAGESFLPSTLRVKEKSDDKFKLSLYMNKDRCFYRLSKNQNSDWMAMQVTELTCSCLGQ